MAKRRATKRRALQEISSDQTKITSFFPSRIVALPPPPPPCPSPLLPPPPPQHSPPHTPQVFTLIEDESDDAVDEGKTLFH